MYFKYDGDKNFRVSDGYLREFGRILYIGILGFWIGLGIRWTKNSHGQINPSPFNHATNGTYPVKYYRIWYFGITICRPHKTS